MITEQDTQGIAFFHDLTLNNDLYFQFDDDTEMKYKHPHNHQKRNV